MRLGLAPEANSATRIMAAINALTPAGKTPLTAAVAQAADVLDFRAKPGLIVLLTDGEETCGGSPCDLGKELSGEAAALTVHVVGLRVKGYTWMGEQSLLETKCLAERNGGLYLTVETEDELQAAFEKTLGCPDGNGTSAGVSALFFVSPAQAYSKFPLLPRGEQARHLARGEGAGAKRR